MTNKGIFKFLAVVLSIFLVLSLIVSAVFQVFNNTISAKNILKICVEMVDDRDSDVLPDEVPKKVLKTLFKSEGMEQVTELFIDALRASFVTGELELDEDDLADILKENKKDMIRAVKKADLTDEELDEFKDNYDEYCEDLALTLTESMDMEMEKNPIFAVIFSKAAPIICWIVTVLLAALIFMCRFTGYKGMLWLGIDSIIAALPIFALRVVMDLAEAEAGDEAMAQYVFDNINGHITAFAAGMLVIGIILIVAHVVVRKLIRKKEAASVTAEQPTEQPAEQSAEQSV